MMHLSPKTSANADDQIIDAAMTPARRKKVKKKEMSSADIQDIVGAVTISKRSYEEASS